MSVVYVAHSPRQRLRKIGHATDTGRRMKGLATGCPDIYIEATYPGGSALEGYLHKAFAAYRIGGEWFDLPPGWHDLVTQAIQAWRGGHPPSRAFTASNPATREEAVAC